MNFMKEQAGWLVDALISVTELCTKIDSLDQCDGDLRVEANELYNGIREFMISALSTDVPTFAVTDRDSE